VEKSPLKPETCKRFLLMRQWRATDMMSYFKESEWRKHIY